MMVDLHMKDGRTTFRFKSRALAVQTMKRNLLNLGDNDTQPGSVQCWARCHTQSEFVPARVQAIAPNSVAMVIQVPPEQRDAFLAEFDDQREREEVPA